MFMWSVHIRGSWVKGTRRLCTIFATFSESLKLFQNKKLKKKELSPRTIVYLWRSQRNWVMGSVDQRPENPVLPCCCLPGTFTCWVRAAPRSRLDWPCKRLITTIPPTSFHHCLCNTDSYRSVTWCSGLNSVPLKFMCTRNLRLWTDLEIGSLQM